MSNYSVEIIELHDLEAAISTIKKLSGNEFIYYEKDDMSISLFAEKQLKYGHFLTSYINNEPAGYICYYSNDTQSKNGYITSLVVKGRGLNKGRVFYNLLKEAVLMMNQDGMNNIKIQVNIKNTNAVKLYEKYGFKYTGEENENGVFMCVSLDKLLKIKKTLEKEK